MYLLPKSHIVTAEEGRCVVNIIYSQRPCNPPNALSYDTMYTLLPQCLILCWSAPKSTPSKLLPWLNLAQTFFQLL